jgi:hypothetical protein
MRNPNASANELRRVIEVDPPLSARILRRANSASSGLKRSICSIQEAIVLLGFNTVRELAFSLKVAKIFSGGEGRRAELRKRLWKHSLAVALCAKQLYRLEFKERGEGIYSAGFCMTSASSPKTSSRGASSRRPSWSRTNGAYPCAKPKSKSSISTTPNWAASSPAHGACRTNW